MNVIAPVQVPPKTIVYPESDGQPMANNSTQYEKLTEIKDNLEVLLKHDLLALVEGDMLWYPQEGNNKLRVAPDVFVVFGRPKGPRGAYLQWREGHIAPQVVFEILSPGNTFSEMTHKFQFYQRYGVEEYYVYDPERGTLDGWLRHGTTLEAIEEMQGWISPRLGIIFALNGDQLDLYYPDGRKFESFVEVGTRAEQERQRAEQERQRAERLAAQLRALGFEPET